jgi:hypothetical protein
LKKTIETRCSRYGVPPLGGFCAAPPKGGTPNRVFKQALITLEQVEADVRKLSPPEQAQLRGWLEDLLEDRLELTDSFKAEIEAGKKDIAEGRIRIRRPLQ